MNIQELLANMRQADASDLYLSHDAPPSMKVNGVMQTINDTVITGEQIKQIAYSIMNEKQIAAFEQRPEMNLAINDADGERFRVNIFKQKDQIAIVARYVKSEIPDYKVLGLPEVLTTLVMKKRGLILVVGATGSGKSTTLASLIDFRNAQSAGHIITVEDPVEFVYPHRKSIVNQRELGVDTQSYDDALKNTLRQAPDVILIGEIRTRETMEHAIAFAETGHLCLSTLHANNANQTLDRIINFFPEDRRQQLLLDLSLNLRAILSQRLIPTLDGKRTLALEVMLVTPHISNLIRRGEVHEIRDAMEKSQEDGMQTFDAHIIHLCQAGMISEEEALRNADSPNNVRLKLSLQQNGKSNDKVKLSMQGGGDKKEDLLDFVNRKK